MLRRCIVAVMAIGIVLAGGRLARAQGVPGSDAERIDRLEKQNQELWHMLQSLQNGQVATVPALTPASGAQQQGSGSPLEDQVRKAVDDALKQKEAGKKAEDDDAKAKADEEGYQVGSSLQMSLVWDVGPLLATPNGDFTMHIGAFTMLDNVFFTQSPGLLNPQGSNAGPAQKVASGAKLGGIGNLEDGESYRRIYPYVEGNFLQNYEYRLILALTNDQFSTVGLDEFWFGATDIPGIGTIRIGHVKTPMGLEGDMTSSSRNMTFLERSAYSESIELNQNFVTGMWLSDTYFDQRATYSFAAFRQDLGSASGVFYGDGQWGLQGRLTALPVWEEDGRCWMHIGLSGGWRNGTNNLATSSYRTFDLRARPELRDDDPAADPSGSQPVPNTNDARMIDTGTIAASNDWLMGLEYCWVVGPFSVQAEYGWNFLEDAVGINPAGFKFAPALTSPQNYAFSGGYVQLAYTLTGENRAYDKRIGTLSRYYYGKEGPYNNAWFVRGDDGRTTFNWGSWEIAGRYSYVNLNDGQGSNRIQGGVMNSWTVGLNWMLNVNVRFMFDYMYAQRSDMPVGSYEGTVQGLGIRAQFMF
jgi:phosphate-selective porin OprO and OprP